MTFAAVEKRIGKSREVTARHPGLRVHKDSGVETDVIAVFGDEFLPPGFFHVVFEFYAERAVVPRVGESAVNFAAGVDKTSAFA